MTPFAPAALRDVSRRWQYLLVQSNDVRVADRYLAAVYSTVALLEQQPAIGILCHPKKIRIAALRRFAVKRPFEDYIIFYSVDAAGILVLRIIHGAKQWPAALR